MKTTAPCRTPCAATCADRIAPQAARWDREAHFPQAELRGLAALGCYGVAVPAEWGGAGLDYLALARHPRGDRRRRRRHLDHRQRQQLSGVLDPDGLGRRGAEAAMARAAGARRDARRLLPDRAARRLRGRRPAHHGAPRARRRRRRLRAERRQAVHHQRQERRRGDRHGGDGQGGRQEGHQRLRRADLDTRLRRRAARGEDRPARERHGADRLRGLPHPGREPPRRGGRGAEDRALGPRGRAYRHRRAERRHGARGLRRRARLCQAARRLRQADLRAPGGAVPARRDGDRGRGRRARWSGMRRCSRTPACRA